MGFGPRLIQDDVVMMAVCSGDPTQDWEYVDEETATQYGLSAGRRPDHGDFLYWVSLNLDLGTNDFEYPERVKDAEQSVACWRRCGQKAREEKRK